MSLVWLVGVPVALFLVWAVVAKMRGRLDAPSHHDSGAAGVETRRSSQHKATEWDLPDNRH